MQTLSNKKVLILGKVSTSCLKHLINNYKEIVIKESGLCLRIQNCMLNNHDVELYKLDYVKNTKVSGQVTTTPCVGSRNRSYIIMHGLCTIPEKQTPIKVFDYLYGKLYWDKGCSLYKIAQEGEKFIWFSHKKKIVPFIIVPSLVFTKKTIGFKPTIKRKTNIITVEYSEEGDYYMVLEEKKGKSVQISLIERNIEGNEQELEKLLLV